MTATCRLRAAMPPLWTSGHCCVTGCGPDSCATFLWPVDTARQQTLKQPMAYTQVHSPLWPTHTYKPLCGLYIRTQPVAAYTIRCVAYTYVHNLLRPIHSYTTLCGLHLGTCNIMWPTHEYICYIILCGQDMNIQHSVVCAQFTNVRWP